MPCDGDTHTQQLEWCPDKGKEGLAQNRYDYERGDTHPLISRNTGCSVLTWQDVGNREY
jgi:hypothetical protein